jgi:hypothetical protein
MAPVDIIRMIRSRILTWAVHVACMGSMRIVYNISVGKLKRRRPQERSRLRCKNIIRMYLREIGKEGVDWINVAQDRNHWLAIVNTVMNLDYVRGC